MTPVRKRLLLFSLLGLAVGASVWVTYMPQDTFAEVVTPVSIDARSVQPLPRKPEEKAAQMPALESIQRSAMAVGEVNPFNSKSWYVPPPPAPQPPPPKPTAPPLPFTYIGKLEEEGRWVVYLTKGEQFYTVSKGETFDEVYRLDGVENGNLVIQYLPLSAKQFLMIGAES